MNVLSLFDGMSCGQIALNKIGITPKKYYAAEIDKYAIKVTQENYPDTIQVGSVTDWRDWDIDWASIDLVSGGFPCQAWSVAGKQQGDKDERGMLFWTMLDIIKHVLWHNPQAKYLMENVRMKKEFEEYITLHTEQALGKVEKHLINSALVSAQNRNRYYWTNIQGIEQPKDLGLVLGDVLEAPAQFDTFTLKDNSRVQGVTEDDRGFRPHRGDKSKSGLSECGRILKETALKTDTVISAHAPKVLIGRIVGRKINPITGKRDDYNSDLKAEQRIEPRLDEKCGTLTTVQKDNVLIVREATKKGFVEIEPGQCVDLTFPTSKTRRGRKMEFKSNCLTAANHEYSQWNGLTYRKLTPLECERLQTVPDGYTDYVSNSQRYKMIGNGWTVDVIAHIYKNL